MTETFQTRIPTLSDAELRNYLQAHGRYKAEAVEAAAAELRRRGQDVPDLEWRGIQRNLKQRDAFRHPGRGQRKPGFLHDGTGPRKGRIRFITALIATTGLGSAAALYHRAAMATSAVIDLEPRDSKKYLRELEYIGGKANVFASDARHWLTGLWQGKSLASTVLWLSFGVALTNLIMTSPDAESQVDDA